ncbi:MAG: NADH-quinone oxidoreductase subunit C [Alphaproteobacteria bacterium]
MDEALKDLGDYIAAALPQDVIGTEVAFGELAVTVRPASIVRVLSFLRDDSTCLFKVLIDLSGADYPEREARFEVIYSLLSMSQNQRVRVKLSVGEDDPVPSATGVYSAAGWYERETWDMYGIYFSDHPDLRRILTDYGFEGHPMRKDFPLTGRVEVRYDETQKRVVYDPVKLTQDFRSFDFLSPWEGMGEILPGDEKASTDTEEGAESA